MTVKRTFYCDALGCETHGSSEMPSWIIVSESQQPRKHFCNGDCLMKWAASWSEPPIVIPLHDDNDEPRVDRGA